MFAGNHQMDKRMTCKYGVRCYQKNPEHHKKYKHPPKRGQAPDKKDYEGNAKRLKPDPQQNEVSPPKKEIKTTTNDISDSDEDIIESVSSQSESNDEGTSSEAVPPIVMEKETSPSPEQQHQDSMKISQTKEFPYKGTESKTFIKEKFLVEMPEDFYEFWNFCKSINSKNPSVAFQDAELLLVGPYDVLNGKFASAPQEFTDEQFLCHWRYYYDPPEFQTVLKGNDKTGYHIGYFRDNPKENPVFMACNSAGKDGILTTMGANIFAAVCLYLEEKVKSCSPFVKVKISKLLNLVKQEAENLKYSIFTKTDEMRNREKKVVTKTFNKIGLVVPYNKKTQLGYRELHLNDKELKNILDRLKQLDHPDDQEKLCDKLQPLFTYTNIAIDECDFGTGVELGWNLIAYGIDYLNKTIARFLRNSYDLLQREEFAKIIVAHMENRRKGSKLSIV